MKKIVKNKYGFLGFLSLLGFIGVFTDERWFLCFFFWILDFKYFFVVKDEAFEYMMKKASCNAFFIGLIISVISTMTIWLTHGVDLALRKGCTWGFVSSLIVFTILLFYYEQTESQVLENENR